MCEELDQSCFLQYFLISSLKKYIGDLVKLNDKSLSRSENILFNYLQLTDTYVIKVSDRYAMYRINFIRYNIIRYLRIQNSIVRQMFSTFKGINEKDLTLFVISL